MNISLLYTDAPNNQLNKSVEQIAEYSGAVARVNVSVENPVLILEESVSNIMSANYCYIAEFGRYYYIVDKTADANGLWTIALKVDVLKSFASSIDDLKGIVQRQRDNYDMYLKDDRIPVSARKTVAIRQLGSVVAPGTSASHPSVIMLVLGG